MGFFSKKKKEVEDDIPMLRTLENGGVDKLQVYTQISSYKNIIIEFETAIKAMNHGRPFHVPAVPENIHFSEVKNNGFDKNDVTAYFSKLDRRIKELKEQLH